MILKKTKNSNTLQNGHEQIVAILAERNARSNVDASQSHVPARIVIIKDAFSQQYMTKSGIAPGAHRRAGSWNISAPEILSKTRGNRTCDRQRVAGSEEIELSGEAAVD